MNTQPAVSGCATVARRLAEPLRATAPLARGWVLIEQPGAWGPDAVLESDLAPEVGSVLKTRATEVGVRLQVIRRRPGNYPADPRSVMLVRSTRTSQWIEEIQIRDPRELLELDLSLALHDRPPALGRRVEQRVVLVCAHGRHDQCCATYGRPLVRALRGRPEQVWECSHVGGDRFAANIVCLPDGVYYGHVEPAQADDLLDAHATGHVDLDHLRGRTTEPMVVQAAEHALRTQGAITGLDDVQPLDWYTTDRGEHRVTLSWNGGEHEIRLVDDPLRPRVTSCHDAEDWGPNHFLVKEILRVR